MKLQIEDQLYTGELKMNMNKEPWYKSRRMWSAILAAGTAILIQFGYVDVATVLTSVAGSFGVHSWVKPKK